MHNVKPRATYTAHVSAAKSLVYALLYAQSDTPLQLQASVRHRLSHPPVNGDSVAPIAKWHSPSLDTALLDGYLNDMGLGQCEMLLQALPRGSVSAATGPPDLLVTGGICAVVEQVAENVAANPLLLRQLQRALHGREHPPKPVPMLPPERGHFFWERRFWQGLRTWRPVRRALRSADAWAARLPASVHVSAEDAEEFRRLAHYSLILHLVTKAMAADLRLADCVVDTLKKDIRGHDGWWKHLSLFEQAKLLTVEVTLSRIATHRKEHSIPARFGHVGLPFNILEAVLQDFSQGQWANGLAGAVIMCARPGQVGSASLSPDSRRAVRMHMPLPRRWKDLYVSWNMCFTSTYADSPYFAAALLAPCVIGASPEEFMFHRVLALYMHMCCQISRRKQLRVASGAVVQAARDWRHASTTQQWGAANLDAARRFARLYFIMARRRRTNAPLQSPAFLSALDLARQSSRMRAETISISLCHPKVHRPTGVYSYDKFEASFEC